MLEKRISSLWLIGLGLMGTGSLRYDGYVPFFLTVVALIAYMFSGEKKFGAYGFLLQPGLFAGCLILLCFLY